MKVLNKASSVVAIVVCILLFGSALSYGAQWTLYYIDGIDKYYYDKSTIVRPRAGIVQVAIRKMTLDQQRDATRLEMSCNYHTFRILTDKLDPVTGQYVPEGAAGGYKWTWFPLEAPAKALYENICE
jgi:hypothetical protein